MSALFLEQFCVHSFGYPVSYRPSAGPGAGQNSQFPSKNESSKKFVYNLLQFTFDHLSD